jgi:hypothetical protein
MNRRKLPLLALAILLSALAAEAAEASWDVAANLDLEARYFVREPRWPGQASGDGNLSVAAAAGFRWRNQSGNQRAAIVPYARRDEADPERSLFDLREAYWALETDAFELLVGVNTVFWGVAESVHLVDIVNQTDAAADIDGEDKLGQPMLNLSAQRDWGLLSLYLLPYVRERTFAGSEGRLRAPLPVETGAAVFESGAGNEHVDLALRYSHYLGSVDIGLSYFRGTSREPRLLPDAAGTALVPHYDQIGQFGLDLQYTGNAWLWKLEAILREGYADSFAAAVGGFEYTFYQVAGSAADVGLLLEYQHDGRHDFEPLTIADNDVFVGARLALNDIQDTAMLAGFGHDTDTHESFVNVEAERRFGQNYVLEFRARAFAGAAPAAATHAIADDDYVELKLRRYF